MRAVIGALLIATDAFAGGGGARPIAVTIDDLPIASPLHSDSAERRKITADMLAVLKRHRIEAVGFVTWDRLRGEGERELLEMWLDAGHELGNHTRSHPHLARTAVDAYVADAEACRERLAALLAPRGKKVRLFRFPFLAEGDTVEKLEAVRAYLGRSSQRNVCPTIDDQDWSFEEPWVRARRAGDRDALARIACDYQAALRLAVRDQERRGDRMAGRSLPQILLLHAGLVGAAQWDELFAWLTSEGHRFASIDEVLADPIFAEDHRYVAEEGPGLWDRLLASRREQEVRREVEERWRTTWRPGNRAMSRPSARPAPRTPCSRRRASCAAATKSSRATADAILDAAAMGKLARDLDVRTASGIEIAATGDARPGSIHAVSVAARLTIAYDGKNPQRGSRSSCSPRRRRLAVAHAGRLDVGTFAAPELILDLMK
ncbi:MAG: polysaccharide deacetylase family protein [Acidobacteriota bacterium]